MSSHAISTPPSAFYDSAPAYAGDASDLASSVPAWNTSDVLDASHVRSGFEKLPKISTPLVEQIIGDIAPRIEELTGLRVAQMPRIELVENSEMYILAINDLLNGWSGSEREFGKVRQGVVDLLKPKRIWAHLPVVYFPNTDVLGVSIPALRGKNYDTICLAVLGAMVASAACQTYPAYLASLDEARFGFLTALVKAGGKSDGVKQAKTSLLTRGALVRAFAEYWRKFAQSHGYRFANPPSPSWLAKLAVVCSKEARAGVGLDANTGNLLKKHYESAAEADEGFLEKLFNDPAALEALLAQQGSAGLGASGDDHDGAPENAPQGNTPPENAPQKDGLQEVAAAPQANPAADTLGQQDAPQLAPVAKPAPTPTPTAAAPQANAAAAPLQPTRSAPGALPAAAPKPQPPAPRAAASGRARANTWVIMSKAG